MGRRPKYTFLQRQNDFQKAHEKMLSVNNYGRNAHKNYNEVSPHTSQNSHHQTVHKQQMLERLWRKENPPTLGAATMENCMEVP